jgi:hypothetical protein
MGFSIIEIGLPLDLSVPSCVRLSKGGRSGIRAPDIHPGLRRTAGVLFEIGRERDRTGADRCAFSKRISVWLRETKSQPLFTSLNRPCRQSSLELSLSGLVEGIAGALSQAICCRVPIQTESVGGGETILRTGPCGYTRPRFVGGFLSRAGVFQHGAHSKVCPSIYMSQLSNRRLVSWGRRGGRRKLALSIIPAKNIPWMGTAGRWTAEHAPSPTGRKYPIEGGPFGGGGARRAILLVTYCVPAWFAVASAVTSHRMQ